MAFTFVVWAFALIFLLLAVIFYVTFLFYWIPKADGGLTGYCERKVNKALLSIVNKKINKAFAKNEAKKMKAEAKYCKVTGEKLQPERAATLPDIALADDKLPGMPMLNRADTGSTLPAYQTRPSTPGGIELSNMNRAALTRSETNGSESSYSPNVSLMSAAADMGYGPAPTQPPMIPPQRPGTAMSQRGPAPGMVPQRPGTANSQHSQASRAGMGAQYPYGNTLTPRPGMQQPMGPPPGPMPVLGEESSRFGLGPSNSQRSVGSHSVSSVGEPVDGSEHAFRQGAANAAPLQGMHALSQKQFRPYNPNITTQGPAVGNPYSAEQYGNSISPLVRSATMGPAPPSGPMYPAQRSVTGPMPVRAATTDPYLQNASFAPIQRSNTGEEFANGRWVPPSQRNNPQAYDLEAQFNNGQRYQY